MLRGISTLLCISASQGSQGLGLALLQLIFSLAIEYICYVTKWSGNVIVGQLADEPGILVVCLVHAQVARKTFV